MYYLNEITQLEELINKVSAERFELKKSKDLKVQQIFDRNFNYFKEFDIRVSGESAYFQIKNDNGILVDLFSIYFCERYKEERKLELSYYTTNTQSEFELNRIILLGQVALIIKERSETILKEIAEVKKSDLGRENELYTIQDGYEKEKRSYQNANDERRKTEIELSLRGEGVSFDKDVYITLRSNFTPRMTSIKIIEVSKSGKTCTVEYITPSLYKGIQDRCSTQDVISQVTSHSKNIVSTLELA